MSKPGISFLAEEEILATHKPESFPEDIERKISEILKRAEAEGAKSLT